LPVRTRRQRVWRFDRRKAESTVQTSGFSPERSYRGQHRDRDNYPSHDMTSRKAFSDGRGRKHPSKRKGTKMRYSTHGLVGYRIANGAVGVRKPYPRHYGYRHNGAVSCAHGPYRAGCVGPHGAAVVRRPY
jgi:hypothetical protein